MRVRLYLTLDILLEAKFYRVKSHEYRVCLPVRSPAAFFRKPLEFHAAEEAAKGQRSGP